MKTSRPLGTLGLCLLLTIPLFAAGQEPPEEMPGPPPEDAEFMPPPGGPPPGEEGLAPPGPPVDQWMEHLRKERPEDFERLKQLRQDDPQAFRGALHQRLRQERIMRNLKDHPRVMEFLLGLPEQERDQVLRKLAPGGPGRGFRGPPEVTNPEVMKLEAEAQRLAKSYRKAAGDDERAKIRGELQGKLETLFDLREQERARQIERIETDLGKLKKALEDRQAHRADIISRRLGELTDGDALKW